jgi:ribosomal protein S12 methylthiotransferase accessory factor YcaO
MIKLADITAASKIGTIESGLVPGLWLSRCALALETKSDRRHPVFGFAADFDLQLSKRKAIFELIEHLAFHPDKPLLSADGELWQRCNGRWQHAEDVSLDDLLLGAMTFGENLHGNGCAVHWNVPEASTHAMNEALERHYCCEMWYNGSIRPTPLILDIALNSAFDDCVKIYSLETLTDNHLVICIVDADSLDFFCMGASLKPTLQSAIRHSLGEAATIFEDALRQRMGCASTTTAAANILSLRDREQSQKRKQHFSSLLTLEHRRLQPTHPATVYAFPILDGIIAARASTAGLLTPRRYHNKSTSAPVMPLF